MAKLQQSQLFGANSQVVTAPLSITASPESPALVIYLSDLAGLNLNLGIPNHNGILAALLVKVSTFYDDPTNLNDENNNLVVSRNWEALFDRTTDSGVVKKLGVRYAVDCYEPFTGAQDINPNNVY